MRNWLCAVSAAAILASGSAFAADLGRGPPPAPMPPPAPVFTWTGFYAGVNVGYTWTQNNGMNTVSTAGACNTALPGCVSTPNYSIAGAQDATFDLFGGAKSGLIGGGQLGYNVQFNSIVAGLEADIQGIGSSSATSNAGAGTFPVTGWPGYPIVQTGSSSSKLTYLSTVRGRLGVLVAPSFLLYATGGLAFGGVKASTSITQAVPASVGNEFGASFGSVSSTRTGYTLGAGTEWMFAQNWSAKLEYAYYNLGSVSYSNGTLALNCTAVCTGALGSSSAITTTHFSGNIVRVGLNYHF